jgi:hypothetical protein
MISQNIVKVYGVNVKFMISGPSKNRKAEALITYLYPKYLQRGIVRSTAKQIGISAQRKIAE